MILSKRKEVKCDRKVPEEGENTVINESNISHKSFDINKFVFLSMTGGSWQSVHRIQPVIKRENIAAPGSVKIGKNC